MKLNIYRTIHIYTKIKKLPMTRSVCKGHAGPVVGTAPAKTVGERGEGGWGRGGGKGRVRGT